MSVVDISGLHVLTTSDCLRLVQAGGVGRLAFVGGERAIIRPVNFALDGRRIVIRTGEGSIFRAAQRGMVASFEVDEPRNRDHRAWSVIVDGTLHVAEAGGVEHLALRSWAPVPKDHFVELSIDEISGRSVGRAR